MVMYLLDTDTLTHLYAGNTNVIARLNTVKDPEVGITIITKAEMLRGRIEYLIKAETDESLLMGLRQTIPRKEPQTYIAVLFEL